MSLALTVGRWYVLLWTVIVGIGLPVWGSILGVHVHGLGFLVLLVLGPVGALFLGAFLGTILWRPWGRTLGICGVSALLVLGAVNAFFARQVDSTEAMIDSSAVGVLVWFFLPEVRSRFLAGSEA